MTSDPGPLTILLRRLKTGDGDAEGQLFQQLYNELKGLARGLLRQDSLNRTLTPTVLVHDAYLRLRQIDPDAFQDHQHFLRVAAKVMRQLIIDQARAYRAQKRGGDRERIEYQEQFLFSNEREVDLVLAVDEAIQGLRAVSSERCQVVELRYFGGYTFEEVGKILGMSERTAKRHWTLARVWLRGQIDDNVRSVKI